MHEERNRLVDTMVREMMMEKRTHKERINSDQRIKMLLDVRCFAIFGMYFVIYDDLNVSALHKIDNKTAPSVHARRHGEASGIASHWRPE